MIIQRDFYLNKLISRRDNGRIKVVTGIRRCGKSVLLFDLFGDYLRKSGVEEEQIIAMKLDTVTNARYRNPIELDKFVRWRITDPNKQYYVLLDEIQEVKAIRNPWLDDKDEKIGFVDILLGLMDLKNADVYVTGSIRKSFLSFSLFSLLFLHHPCLPKIPIARRHGEPLRQHGCASTAAWGVPQVPHLRVSHLWNGSVCLLRLYHRP